VTDARRAGTERRLRVLVAVVVAGGLVVLLLALWVGPARLGPGDAAVLEVSVDLRSDGGVRAARLLTELGTLGVTLAAVAAACLVLARRHRAALAGVLAGGYALTLVAEQLVRAAEDRPRPGGRLVEVSTQSFPSAHAAHAVTWVAVALAVAHGLPPDGRRRAAVAAGVAVAAIVALTRLYLHVHYLSDVVAGAALGSAAFAAAGLLALLVGRLRHNARRG
jgi:membrane-associated phospholipid phosphatase